MLNKEFYNIFAEDYNSMIPLEKQIESKTKFFKNFIDDSTKNVSDLGAGSGADSIAFAKLGLAVAAFEPSTEMLKQAGTNFKKQNVEVDIYNKKISEIDNSFHNSFDIVVSMGNTLANIQNSEIEKSVKKISLLLKRNGKAVVQLLNYNKVLDEQERIVNITESNNKQFIRFYDFCGEKVFFNILSFYKDDFAKRELITTEIYPYTKPLLKKLFKQNGISKLQFFGDVKFNEFDESKSPNLILVLEK